MLIAAGRKISPYVTHIKIVASTVVPTNTYTQIMFDTVLTDNVGGFNPALPGEIIAPSWAKWVKVTGKLGWAPQNTVGSNSGVARGHLWRNDASTPEAYYHNVYYFQAPDALNPVWSDAFILLTPWIPITVLNEKWSLWAWQNTQQNAQVNGNPETWLHCEFST